MVIHSMSAIGQLSCWSCSRKAAKVFYSTKLSVRNRGQGFARLDFLYGLRNRAIDRPRFLIWPKKSGQNFLPRLRRRLSNGRTVNAGGDCMSCAASCVRTLGVALRPPW